MDVLLLLLLPTFDKLAKELCKIVDTDHYSRDDAKRALANISRWGYAGDDDNSDNSIFLSDFSELGGIQRVLLFLQHNQNDPSCVMVAMKVIMACTHRPFNHPNFSITNEITRSFIMRNGIDIVLVAGKEFSNNNNDNKDTQQQQQQLHALRWIWMVLMNVTEKTSTFEIVEKDQLLAIFDSFLETMPKLVGLRNNATTNAATVTTNNKNKIVVSPKKSSGDNKNSIGFTTVQPDACDTSSAATDTSLNMNIVQRAFSSFYSPTAPRKRSFIETTTVTPQEEEEEEEEEEHPQGGEGGVDKITAHTPTPTVDISKSTKLTSLVLEDMFITLLNVIHNGRMTRDDFQGTDLISKCIGALEKNPKGDNGEWMDNNQELYSHASCFLVQCSHKEILSTKEDFWNAFPFIVECIRRYPEDAFHNKLLEWVRKAYSVLVVVGNNHEISFMERHEKSFIERSIFGALATVLSQDVSEATKDASHQLLRELLALLVLRLNRS